MFENMFNYLKNIKQNNCENYYNHLEDIKVSCKYNCNHLKDINLSYKDHLIQALSHSKNSFYASVIFLCHGLFPNLFIHTGSDIIYNLNLELQNKKNN